MGCISRISSAATRGLAALVLAAALSGCQQDTDAVTSPTATALPAGASSATDLTGPTVRDIVGTPERYLGQTVTVRGILIERIGDDVLAIQDPSLSEGDALLVVAPSYASSDEPEVVLVVSGEVRQIGEAGEVTAATGEGVDPSLLVAHAGKPVIVAQSISVETPAGGQGN